MAKIAKISLFSLFEWFCVLLPVNVFLPFCKPRTMRVTVAVFCVFTIPEKKPIQIMGCFWILYMVTLCVNANAYHLDLFLVIVTLVYISVTLCHKVMLVLFNSYVIILLLGRLFNYKTNTKAVYNLDKYKNF